MIKSKKECNRVKGNHKIDTFCGSQMMQRLIDPRTEEEKKIRSNTPGLKAREEKMA